MHQDGAGNARRREHGRGRQPRIAEVALGKVAAPDRAHHEERPPDDRGAREEALHPAPVPLRLHAVDGPRLERAAHQRGADRVDELEGGAVREAARARVEDERGGPRRAAEHEGEPPPGRVRQRAGRHLEHEDRDQIDGEDQVDLEEIEAAAQQEERIDRRQEELRQAVAAEEQVERALGAGHGEPLLIPAGHARSQTQGLHAR